MFVSLLETIANHLDTEHFNEAAQHIFVLLLYKGISGVPFLCP